MNPEMKYAIPEGRVDLVSIQFPAKTKSAAVAG